MSEPLVPINLVSMPAEMDYDFAANRVMRAWWLPKPSPSRSSHAVFARLPNHVTGVVAYGTACARALPLRQSPAPRLRSSMMRNHR